MWVSIVSTPMAPIYEEGSRRKAMTSGCASAIAAVPLTVVDAERAAETVLQVDAVAQWQYPRRLVGADRDAGEQGVCGAVYPAGEILQRRHLADVERRRDAAGAGDPAQAHPGIGVARLHSGPGLGGVFGGRGRTA